MSQTAARSSKRFRTDCHSCRLRKARFACRGVVRADRDHTLCFECYRAERNRRRAARLAPTGPFRPARREPSAGQIAHRRRMLAHLLSGT